MNILFDPAYAQCQCVDIAHQQADPSIRCYWCHVSPLLVLVLFTVLS